MKENSCRSKNNRELWNVARLTILASLVYLEYFVSKCLFGTLVKWHWIALTASAVVGVALFVWGLFSKEGKVRRFARPKWDLITNFFENTIGGGFIAIVLLFWFLTHLQLTYIAVAGLVMSDLNEGPAWKYLCLVFVILLSLFLSLFLYPRSPDLIPAKERQFMLSGLSAKKGEVSLKNIDLLLKPFTVEHMSNLKNMIVIPSTDKLSLAEDLAQLYKGSAVDEQDHGAQQGHFPLKDVALAALSKITDDQDVRIMVEGCDFILETATDYDEFADCVEVIDKTMKKYEKKMKMKPEDTLLYISPGTGAIGAALSAFAIPGSRLIAYFTQLKEEKKEMKFFDVRVSGLDRVYAEISENYLVAD